jgi:hypothetical protein
MWNSIARRQVDHDVVVAARRPTVEHRLPQPGSLGAHQLVGLDVTQRPGAIAGDPVLVDDRLVEGLALHGLHGETG